MRSVYVLLWLFAIGVVLLADGCNTEWQLPNFCEKWEDRTGCPRIYSPVCADGNRQFPTDCVMCKKIKEERLNITSYTDGPC
ncbi:trypsin inhibitor ClTI-1-like [Asterias rubens]|uniref:trypsin inhibitor ClTI-1-like n=1 Tax=Asterias rubens TaxID=7604 RepID=UPI000FECBE7F|nr:trypsin inhibitor ClTI-1-like [Asterias rubens]